MIDRQKGGPGRQDMETIQRSNNGPPLTESLVNYTSNSLVPLDSVV